MKVKISFTEEEKQQAFNEVKYVPPKYDDLSPSEKKIYDELDNKSN